LDEEDKKALEDVKPENLPRLYDGAIQGANATAALLVAEVFGLFIIFTLAQPLVPWPPGVFIVVRDALLVCVSLVVSVLIVASYERLYHQNIFANWVGEKMGLAVDKDRFYTRVDRFTETKFRLFARLSVAMRKDLRIVLVLGIVVLILMWVAVLM